MDAKEAERRYNDTLTCAKTTCGRMVQFDHIKASAFKATVGCSFHTFWKYTYQFCAIVYLSFGSEGVQQIHCSKRHIYAHSRSEPDILVRCCAVLRKRGHVLLCIVITTVAQ